jgi:hypothetical protein
MKLIAKLLYIPFGIVFGMVGRMAAKQVFGLVWRDDKPPSARNGEVPLHTVVLGNTLHAATHKATLEVFDRAGANTFRWLFGAWPD